MTEDELIARYFAPLAGEGAFGLADDAAVLSVPEGATLVVSVDALVAGVHFFPSDPPYKLAQKALRVNLSDLAAKAAEPLGFLLTLALPRAGRAAKEPLCDEAWLAAFAAGLAADSATFGCPLLGGDTVSTPGPLMLSITIFGTVPVGKMLPRTGFRVGDVVCVTGTIGDGALGLIAHPEYESAKTLQGLDARHRAALVERYLVPQPRLALRRALRAHAHGGMDVSDGLIGDITKALSVSGVGGCIHLSDIPLSPAAKAAVALDATLLSRALTGGDDYELLLCVASGDFDAFASLASQCSVTVTAIGTVCDKAQGIRFVDAAGVPVHFAAQKYSHF